MEFATLAGQDGYQEPNGNNPHQHPISCDIKPRLTKEQHDILEAHYQSQPKPSTNTKKSFAESLNVSLDKVNNWFQNRRAKSKQDAKKQAGAYNLFQSQQSNASMNFGSDSETSPAFASPDYFSMMQHFSDEGSANAQELMSQQNFEEQGLPQGFAYSNSSIDDFTHLAATSQGQGDFFDSPQEMNRRTMTQDQFDAFAAMQGTLPGQHGDFEASTIMMQPDQEAFQQIFPDLSNGQIKEQSAFVFPHPMTAPISSHDSTVSDNAGYPFPSAHTMQEQATISSNSSEWTGSRTSSVADLHEIATQQQQQHSQSQQVAATASQWQPGQSVPVNIEDLSAQFRQAAQARQSPPTQGQPGQQPEQPLAWPADEAFMRRDSSASVLAQQMGHVGITTPQPQQQGTFKTPGPANSIAARRQRPRPAALGLVSARSQSYSGSMQPASPGQTTQHQQAQVQGQQLRRIKSSNVVNGIAHGRVQKSLPGSAPRSPMNFTFADAMQSPKIARHGSNSNMSNLAPPTPLSPSQHAQQDQQGQVTQWQAKSGPITRQPSISEMPDESCHSTHAFVSGPAPPHQNFSSPPHTPMYQGHPQFVPPQIPAAHPIVNENTPPQSAPATQQCFPMNQFPHPGQDMHPPQMPPPPPPQQQQDIHYVSNHAPSMEMSNHAQLHQLPASGFPQGQPQQFLSTPLEGPMQFAHGGVPMVNGHGELQLVFPQQFQFVQHQPQIQQAQPMQPPTPLQHPFNPNLTPPGAVVMTQPAKQPQQPAAELFVHEYNPPSDVKRSGTPRKTVDNGPKNYTFANQGPEHFEKKNRDEVAKARAGGTSSNSPASSNGGSS